MNSQCPPVFLFVLLPQIIFHGAGGASLSSDRSTPRGIYIWRACQIPLIRHRHPLSVVLETVPSASLPLK